MRANDIIKIALAEVGVKEIPANSNNVKYNTWFYGRQVSGASYPWCCAFVSWVFYKAGAGNLIKKTASCADMLQWFKSNGRFITKNPQPGDLIFYKFGNNGRASDHIGIVEKVNGNIYTCIEGNTGINSQNNGGEVMIRARFSKIVGFGRPAYDDNLENKYPLVQYGSKGGYVEAWQNYLNTLGYVLDVDGIYGKKTLEAVKDWQRSNGLKATGIITDAEWELVGK